jgi:F-type H+-transporting ATPase subunit b
MRMIRNSLAFAAIAVPFALSSLSAWAEGTEAAESGGLPQFNPAFYSEQVFWLLVSFAVLYAMMAYVALPRVAKTQSNRKTVIAAEIETARAANEAAKVSVAAVEKSLSEARANAQARVGEMLAKVAEEANGHRAAREKELLRNLRRAEEDIATTRTAALEQVRTSAADLAKAVVDKILEAKAQVKA